MHPRRSKSAVAGAAALAAAVIGSVIGVPTGAVAAPRPTPGTSSTDPSTAADAPSSDGSLSVYPRPQSLHQQGPAVRVTQVVTVVAGEGVDGTVLDPVREALTDAGARRVDVVRPGSAPASGLLVYAGGTEAARALRSLDAPSAIRLPAGGYVLASGQATLDGVPREVVAFAGRDPDGAFHAAQTLRQLAADGEVPGVVVRDWPTAPVRGTVEGFYGAPWTHAQRLAQLDFLGRTKQNRYLYAPGADPYRQTRWRQAYPRAQAVQFEALAERARRNHVVLAWAVSPGQSLCFSSAKDITALTSKLEAMWELGVRGFQLQFQDVAYDEWHCGADRDAFGTGPEAAAKAQARVANAVATWLNDRYGSAPGALSVLPTEYYQDGSSEYRAALADALDDDIEVAWTGVGVVPRTITGQELADARETFGHPLVTMDNYPVNDFADDRVFLGPTTGREPAVATTSTQVLANAGRQPVASRIALFTSADFAWNPRAYRAQDSWHAALRDLAGGDPAALRGLTTLARNSASSALDRRESAYLQPVIDAFWQALDEDPAGATHRTEVADLRSAFDDMADAPRRVEQVADGALARELRPWLDQLGRYGTAGRSAVDMLTAQGRDDGTGAWTEQVTVERLRKELRHGTATVGEGVLDPFLDRALDTADRWTGARADVRTPTTSMGAARDHEPPLMVDSSDDTAYWTDTAPQPGDTFGVDLGVAQPVTDVRIAMGGRGTAADDFLRDAVLEYDADDGSGWRQVPARTGKRTITATFPRGARAKEIRLRATSPQPTRVSVRAFIVNTPDTVRPEVTGGPAAGADHPLAAAADGDPATAYRAAAAPTADGSAGPGALTVRFGATRPLDRVTLLTDPQVRAKATVQAHIPGWGWEDLGRLGTGWTELDGGGAKADAVRLSWTEGSPAPVVHEVIPWFQDSPAARLLVQHGELDAVIGGAPTTVEATVGATRPTSTTGTLTAEAPAGVTVSAPGQVPLPRGGQRTVPVEISVPAGTTPGKHSVPVTLQVDGRVVRQDLTVRAFPATAGPDLARDATASSSGDETPDLPASAVTDGDPNTRWSSPAEDDAWVQLQLADTARIGQLVLHWQDAHAAAYRVEVSLDGEQWRTAATVHRGTGGTETVRMDAPNARYIRVQGVRRATPYGYSLFGMEVYAIQE